LSSPPGLQVGQRSGQGTQVLEGDARAQEGVDVGQACELVQRCHRVLGTIDTFDPPGLFRVGSVSSEQAGAVEVQEWVEELDAEGVEGDCVVLRDVGVAEDLAYHRP